MGKLAIFDYSTTSIHIYEEEFKEDWEPEDVIANLGFDLDNCYYMCGEYIEVIEHEGVLK